MYEERQVLVLMVWAVSTTLRTDCASGLVVAVCERPGAFVIWTLSACVCFRSVVPLAQSTEKPSREQSAPHQAIGNGCIDLLVRLLTFKAFEAQRYVGTSGSRPKRLVCLRKDLLFVSL